MWADDFEYCGDCCVCDEPVDLEKMGNCGVCKGVFHWSDCGSWKAGKHMCNNCMEKHEDDEGEEVELSEEDKAFYNGFEPWQSGKGGE